MIGRGDWGLLRRLLVPVIACLLKVQDTHGVRLFTFKRRSVCTINCNQSNNSIHISK